MGIRLKNIITDYQSTEDLVFLDEFQNSFPFVQSKRFNSQFEGIIGQIDESKVEQKSYNDAAFLRNHRCENLEDAFDIIYAFEDQIPDFSKDFPDKSFVYVDVDCFGGNCLYEGFIIKNGEVKYQQVSTRDGHIQLLQKLNPAFTNWYFEPFSRDFFIKKGTIQGLIKNFSIAGLWLVLKTDYPDTKKYYVDGGASSLILRCHHNYYYYFTAIDQGIEVKGIIYNDEENMLQEIINIPDQSFLGMQYKLEIRLFDKNDIIKKHSDDWVDG